MRVGIGKKVTFKPFTNVPVSTLMYNTVCDSVTTGLTAVIWSIKMPINVMSKKEYDKVIKTLKKDGEAITEQFASVVLTGISLYWGESNHNIQVINDLVDCARVFKGLRVKALVEYLNQTVPHENGGQKDGFHYAKVDKKKRKVMEGTWEQFLEENPDWSKFTTEKDPTPFSLLKFVGLVQKTIKEAHEKDELNKAELKLFKQQVNSITF